MEGETERSFREEDRSMKRERELSPGGGEENDNNNTTTTDCMRLSDSHQFGSNTNQQCLHLGILKASDVPTC